MARALPRALALTFSDVAPNVVIEGWGFASFVWRLNPKKKKSRGAFFSAHPSAPGQERSPRLSENVWRVGQPDLGCSGRCGKRLVLGQSRATEEGRGGGKDSEGVRREGNWVGGGVRWVWGAAGRGVVGRTGVQKDE